MRGCFIFVASPVPGRLVEFFLFRRQASPRGDIYDVVCPCELRGLAPTVTVPEALVGVTVGTSRDGELRASTYCEGALETREDELSNDMYFFSWRRMMSVWLWCGNQTRRYRGTAVREPERGGPYWRNQSSRPMAPSVTLFPSTRSKEK